MCIRDRPYSAWKRSRGAVFDPFTYSSLLWLYYACLLYTSKVKERGIAYNPLFSTTRKYSSPDSFLHSFRYDLTNPIILKDSLQQSDTLVQQQQVACFQRSAFPVLKKRTIKNRNAIKSVSYTHLDVYKRQVLPQYHTGALVNKKSQQKGQGSGYWKTS